MKSVRKKAEVIAAELLAGEAEEAKKAGAIGYMARAMVMATMPHRKVKGSEFERRNGAYTLSLLAPSRVGLPYGALPRVLTIWVSTEAVKTQERRLVLGNRLSDFMRLLGLVPTGGRWGSITRLRDQMRRLFSSSVSCTYDDGKHWALDSVKVVQQADLWWDPKSPEQAGLWESTLMLGERFFREVIEHPVPIDVRAIRELRRSPMAIDIYCWLTYRMSYLGRPTKIPWELLEMQFGADYKRTYDFKVNFEKHLKSVLVVYKEARVENGDGGLLLKPSPTHIRRSLRSARM